MIVIRQLLLYLAKLLICHLTLFCQNVDPVRHSIVLFFHLCQTLCLLRLLGTQPQRFLRNLCLADLCLLKHRRMALHSAFDSGTAV